MKYFVEYSSAWQLYKRVLNYNAYFSNIIFAAVIAQFPHLYALVKRLLLAFGIMSLCRLLFLWFNYATFSAVPFLSLLKSFIGGIWFDC
ncbi:MAG: hypothetical protein EAY81_00530, partial [Bacteroidetes bacterium]